MAEKRYISKKQYRILLAFSLMMIFTTGTIPAFCGASIQIILFCMINYLIFSRVSNKRICWGAFLGIAALFGEGMFLLSGILPDSFSSGGFFLLPASTFLFLSVPMFDYMNEERSITKDDFLHGFLYFLPTGLLISIIRELCGEASFCGRKIETLMPYRIRFFGHTAGSALLVLASLILLWYFKNSGEEKKWTLETQEKKIRIFRPISIADEKRFVILCLCMLLYDLLFGAIGALVIFNVPSVLHHPAHIVLLSSVTSILLLTLIIVGLKQTETMDEYNYVPFLCVITTSLPLIFYMRYLNLPQEAFSPVKIIWWVALMVGVWLFSALIIAYTRVINGRLMFGKQPACLEGIPLIILHILLAMVVFMPWTQVMVNL
ncbi:MAG: hypothetical protein J5379_07680 [Clostridiales bacterium]|nr:hypothetical protein [Clostridiales bacterium]